jgi:hypothetical protein
MSVFVKMDQIIFRAFIKYLFLKGNTPTQNNDDSDSVFDDPAPSFFRRDILGS